MVSAPEKILVIRGGAIGDFILTLPVFTALRQRFQPARLEILGYPHIAQLALAGELVHAVRSIEARSLAGFFVPDGILTPELREYFSGFDLIISYLYDPDEIFQANIACCSPVSYIVGSHRPDETPGIHATETFLKALEQLGISGADSIPRLHLPSSVHLPARLAIHPGSGSERKNWPLAQWLDLIQCLLRETPWHFLLIGGEAEGDRLRRLNEQFPPDRLQIARSLPLVELARQIATCAAFLGHDSGITHLAAALDLPVCVLWGTSTEAVWKPLGSQVQLLRGGKGLNDISVDQVRLVLRKMLEISEASRGR